MTMVPLRIKEMDYFYSSSPIMILVLAFGVMVLIALIATGSPSSVNARAHAAAAARNVKVAPKEIKEVVLNPLTTRAAPAIVRHTPAVTLETKSVTPVAAPEPVAAPVAAPEPVAAPKSKLDATFDAYRNAMKASSQRSADAHSVSIGQKAGSANSAAWREQSSSLRSALRGQNTAAYLESMHQSVDDRLVAMFDAVPV